MKIGLFAKPGLIPHLLLERINHLAPGSGHLFDWTPGTGRLLLDADHVVWNDQPLTGFDRMWIHGFSYANPVIPDATLQRDWSVWQVDYLSHQQEYSALFSLFEELDRRGVTLFNPPRIHLGQSMKFALLEGFRASGFQVPALLCSNDMENVDLFCREMSTVVWRPATGRAAWQLFQKKQRKALIDPNKPPVLLAEGISGPLMRGYLLNGQMILCLQHSPPQHTPPMESLGDLWSVSCAEQAAPLQRLAQEWGVAWAVITFVPSSSGPWIYDLDPDPLLDWLPIPFRDFLLTCLAETLTGRDHTAIAPQLDQERPTLFLRRLLKILFELEHSKYVR